MSYCFLFVTNENVVFSTYSNEYKNSFLFVQDFDIMKKKKFCSLYILTNKKAINFLLVQNFMIF